MGFKKNKKMTIDLSKPINEETARNINWWLDGFKPSMIRRTIIKCSQCGMEIMRKNKNRFASCELCKIKNQRRRNVAQYK